jgi:hypothetical protein
MPKGPEGQKRPADDYAYISFRSWELIDQEAALQKLIMEFVGTDQERAHLVVEALSSLKPVTIRVPRKRESEFVEKMKELGAHISK